MWTALRGWTRSGCIKKVYKRKKEGRRLWKAVASRVVSPSGALTMRVLYSNRTQRLYLELIHLGVDAEASYQICSPDPGKSPGKSAGKRPANLKHPSFPHSDPVNLRTD